MKRLLVLLILPMMLMVTAEVLNRARGPYWIGYNCDPAYAYLLNSLNLAEAKEVGHTDHPGTTLQLLGAATLRISHAVDFSEKDNLEVAVLKNPETYLSVLNAVMIILNGLLLVILGMVTFTLTKKVWLSVLLQFSPFLSTTVLAQLANVSCEPLLLFASSLLMLILMKMVVSESLAKPAPWCLVMLALVSGFGIATKVTFVPLLIIPLFVLPTLRNIIVYVMMTGFSIILWTWPIRSQYKPICYWFYGILTHTGLYGKGNVGIIDPGLYVRNLQNLFLGNPAFFLIWFLAAGFILIFIGSSARRKIVWQDTSFRVLVAVVVAQLFAVLMVAKHSADHYLLPALSLSGLTLFLMFVYLQRIKYFNRFDSKKVACFIGIIFISSCVARMLDLKKVWQQNLQVKQQTLAVYQKVAREYKNHLLFSYYRSSSPLFALAFGNNFANRLHSEALQNLYGEAYFYIAWNGTFHTWTKSFLIEELISKGYGGKIIFHGQPIFREKGDQLTTGMTGSTLQLRDVLKGQYETIYVPQSITTTNGETVIISF
jgi:hypothetical protein